MSVQKTASSTPVPASRSAAPAVLSRAASATLVSWRSQDAEWPAWWQGLADPLEIPVLDAPAAKSRRLDEERTAVRSAENAESDREPVSATAASAAVVFDLAQSPVSRADGSSLYAQAPAPASDAPTSISVSKMPPWSVAALGAVGGLALVALASGKDGMLVVNQSWTTSQTLTADANTRLVIDASRLESTNPRAELRLSGPGEVQVLGLKANAVIAADNLLTGTLYVEVADDDQIDDGIKILTGTGNTTIQLRDDRDIVYIDAARLPGVSRLTVQGVTGKLVVSNLTAIIDVTGLTGETEIHTTALPADHPQLKGLSAPLSQVSVLTGDSKTTVNSGRSDEVVTINAAKLGVGDQLTTGGQGRMIVTNFADANLFNNAAGGLDVTLGNGAMELGLVSVASATAASVFNGMMRDGDSINLFGSGAFTVTGLKANLDATNTSGALIDVTTADAGDNQIAVSSGLGSLKLNATAQGDRIQLNARAMTATNQITLLGKSDVDVTQVVAAVDAGSLTGQLTLATSASVPSTMDIKTGSGETLIRVNHTTAEARVDAQSIALGRRLTTEGVGAVTVTGLGVDLINSAGNASSVTLKRQGPASAEFAINVTSATSLAINNGTLSAGDDLILRGAGQLTVASLVADLDASQTSGAVLVNTARLSSGNLGLAIKTGSGDMTVATPTVQEPNRAPITSDTVAIDATRLNKAGGKVTLSGLSQVGLTLTASGADGNQYVLSSSDRDFWLYAAPGLRATDSINVQVEGVSAANTIRVSAGLEQYRIRGLQGSLIFAQTAAAVIDVSLYGGASAPPTAMTYGGAVVTGAANDHLRFDHVLLGGTYVPVTPLAGSIFTLGGGDNQVHVGRGLAMGATFDLSGAAFRADAEAGSNRLVVNDDAKVKVSSAQLQLMTGASTTRVFTDIRQELGTSPTTETLVVDTTAGALGQPQASYLLDDAIEQWEIGTVGGGNNDVTLGKDGQSVRFGAGAPTDSDVVRLAGRSAGDLFGVEKIIVGTGVGNSISEARVTAVEDPANAGIGPGQLSTGVMIDFADQNASLKLTLAQHAPLAAGQLVATGVDAGYQTLVLKNATIDLDGGSGTTVSNLAAAAGIEAYQLGDASLLGARTGEVLAAVSGSNLTARVFGPTGTALAAVNDFSQGSDTVLIRGGSGHDAIRTLGDDTKRGALTIDLSSGGQDLVFINNLAWNSTPDLNAAVTSLTTFASVTGFSTVSSAPDRLAMLSNSGLVNEPGFTTLSAPIASNINSLASGQLIEFDQAYSAASGVDSVNNLPKVAMLINSALGGKADNGAYYFVLYQDSSPSSDAWLYAGLAAGSKGFDYGQAGSQDTLELLAIFTGVGANSFTSANLAWFAAPVINLTPPTINPPILA